MWSKFYAFQIQFQFTSLMKNAPSPQQQTRVDEHDTQKVNYPQYR